MALAFTRRLTPRLRFETLNASKACSAFHRLNLSLSTRNDALSHFATFLLVALCNRDERVHAGKISSNCRITLSGTLPDGAGNP